MPSPEISSRPEFDEQIPADVHELILEVFGPQLGPRFLSAALCGLSQQQREGRFAVWREPKWRNPDPEEVERYRQELFEIIDSVATKRDNEE
jgi:hypothetical protein